MPKCDTVSLPALDSTVDLAFDTETRNGRRGLKTQLIPNAVPVMGGMSGIKK